VSCAVLSEPPKPMCPAAVAATSMSATGNLASNPILSLQFGKIDWVGRLGQ
jgi:hypothetical protein